MKKPELYILIGFLIISGNLFSQDKVSKVGFNGYLSGMPQVAWTNMQLDTISESNTLDQYLLHNRLNFNWYPTSKLTASIQFRNQLMYGDFTKNTGYETGFVTESYFLPLTYQLTYGDAGLLSLSADRAWMQFTHNDLEVKVGRQRINWGQTFVWNPNDIFNAYNFFDFDYTERPGADAVRVIYYPNFTSTLELAVKLDSAANITAAGLYRFNKYGADFQTIGGYLSQSAKNAGNSKNVDSDWVIGLGITRDLKGISLRTEATYMIPTDESVNQDELFLWSLGFDYSFLNQFSISTEFFYSSRISLNQGANIFDMNSGPLTVKNLAFAKYSGFLQGSYPLTPLFKGSLSAMVFKDDVVNGYFIGPGLDFSLKENMDISILIQHYKIKLGLAGSSLKSKTTLGFVRMKWSF